VIVSAYESADTLGDAVASAFDQTLPPLEVIVCDDASSDDVAGALAPFGDRVKLVSHEHNRGLAAARNTASRAASGDFVAVLDADDVYMPQRFEALAALATARPDLDVLSTDVVLTVGGELMRRLYKGSNGFEVRDQRRAILEGCFVSGQSSVRRSALLAAGGWDDSIRWVEDWDLWIRLIFSGSVVGLVPEPLAEYRLHPGSLSSNPAEIRQGEVGVLEKAVASDLGLTAGERDVLSRSLERHRRAASLEGLRKAVATGDPGARRRARSVIRGPGYPASTRLKAAVTAVSPGLTRRLLLRRRRGTWVGAGRLRIEGE
jgi:glycosyltransferase involved in cell wall biosynthesis